MSGTTLDDPAWQPSAADGAWRRLDELELAARRKLDPQLVVFGEPFRDAYEAGVIVPVLRTKGLGRLDVRAAALFHRRMLNDLRGVWLLLRFGYTSQAAAVAASHYECALAANCLLQSQANIDAFLAEPHREIPWSVTEMAKMVVRAEGKTGREFENQWRALYAHYVWLCQIKHASHQSVLHDTSGTALQEGYVVMALPNVRPEDLPVKANIAIIVLNHTFECIETFAKALGVGDPLATDYGFAERFKRGREAAWMAFEPFLKAAGRITVAHSRFVKKHPPIA